MFSRFGKVVMVVSYGTPTNAIPTDAYAGSDTIASQYRPSGGYVAYVQATNQAVMQVNIASTGTFQYGYASSQIVTANVRTSFSYII